MSPSGPPPPPIAGYPGGGYPTPPDPTARGGMGRAAVIVNIVVGSVAGVALIPCFGWLNYFVLSVVAPYFVFSLITLVTEGKTEQLAKTQGTLGVCLAPLILVVSFVRLMLGAGCF